MSIDVDIQPIVLALGLPIKQEAGCDYIRCPKAFHEHDDKRPRCGIKGKTFNCLKCGATGDAVSLVRLVNQCDTKDAIAFIEQTMGLIRGPQLPVDPLLRWARARGYKKATLERFGVKAVGEEVHFPMRNAKGEIIGHSRRRADNGKFKSGDKALTVKGEKNGLFYPPDFAGEGVVAVVEGAPDTIALMDAGHPAPVGTPGANPSRASLRDLQRKCEGRDCILFPDPDEAGSAWREIISQALRAARCNVSYIMPTDRDIDARLREAQDKATALGEIIGAAVPLRAASGEVVVKGDVPVAPYDIAMTMHEKIRNENGRGLLVHYRQDFYLYNSTKYHVLDGVGIDTAVIRTLADLNATDRATGRFIGDVRRNLAAMVNLPADITPPATLSPTRALPNMLSLKSALIDLERAVRGENPIIEADPNIFVINSTRYDYDPKATCPKWDTHLERVLPDVESRGLLQEFCGYCLTQDMSLQKFLLMIGDGRNGKGVTTTTLVKVIGEDNVSAVGLEMFDRPFALIETLGKLVNICGDAPEMDKVCEGVLKSFVGGDPIYFERKYRDGFTTKPTARLIIACNEMPRFADRSLGLWRRVLMVPFNVTISEQEENPDLAKELEGELPGILNWCIEGLRFLRRRGRFHEPKSCETAKADMARTMNPHRTWLEDNLEPTNDPTRTTSEAEAETGPGAVRATDLYERYNKAMKDSGCRPLGEPQFAKEVRRVYPLATKVRPRINGKREYVWANVRSAWSGWSE